MDDDDPVEARARRMAGWEAEARSRRGSGAWPLVDRGQDGRQNAINEHHHLDDHVMLS